MKRKTTTPPNHAALAMDALKVAMGHAILVPPVLKHPEALQLFDEIVRLHYRAYVLAYPAFAVASARAGAHLSN